MRQLCTEGLFPTGILAIMFAAAFIMLLYSHRKTNGLMIREEICVW